MIITTLDPSDDEAAVALWRLCGLTRPWNDPRADIALAWAAPDTAIFAGRTGEGLVATVMVGFDGHRGWVYYLAVVPAARRFGHGRALMDAAESWLRQRGAPKLQLMVREENARTAEFYSHLGYERQATMVLGKWLA